MLFRQGNTKLIVVIILVALLAIGALGCGDEGTVEVVAEEEVNPVEVITAEIGELSQYITKVGNTEPAKSISVSPKLQEQVMDLHISKGDRIAKGDKLLTLDKKGALTQLKQAEAGLKVAQATLDEVLAGVRKEELTQMELALEEAQLNYELVKKSHERQQRLVKEGMISEENFEQSKLRYISARNAYQSAEQSLKMAQRGATEEQIAQLEAQIEQARVEIERAELNLENTKIIAPIEGVVTQLNIEVGELATGGPIVELAVLDSIKLVARLSERNINRIQRGEIEAYFSALDNTYLGEISYISPLAEEQSKRFPVDILIDNSEGLIRAGMYAQVEFIVEESTDQIVIPRRALLSNEEGDYVFIVAEGIAQRRDVEIGLGTAEEVVVLNGIQVGEQVITRGHQQQLFDGDAVEVLDRGDY